MHSEDKKVDTQTTQDMAPSRRRFVGTVAAGVAASAAAVPALAQQAAGGNQPAAGAAREAAKRYPRPPFPNQDQPWPALASKMTPRPDHGEKPPIAAVAAWLAARP